MINKNYSNIDKLIYFTQVIERLKAKLRIYERKLEKLKNELEKK